MAGFFFIAYCATEKQRLLRSRQKLALDNVVQVCYNIVRERGNPRSKIYRKKEKKMTITIMQKATYDNGKTADVDIVCKAHPNFNRCDVPVKDLFDILLEYTEHFNNVEREAVLFEVEQ